MYNRLRLSSIQTHLHTLGLATTSVRLNHLAKARSTCSCSWSLVLPLAKWWMRLNLREKRARIVISCLAFLGNETLRILFIFCGNTRDQAAACFAFSFHKSFQESNPELIKPHTHLTRFILSGLKCTTDFAYRPSKHTYTLSVSRPRAWGLITWLKQDQLAVAVDL